MKHLHKWIGTLIDNLDRLVDEKARIEVLENCGRTCIPRNFIMKVQGCKNSSKDIDEFLGKLNKIWSYLQRDGDNIYVVYEKCYCSLVKAYPDKLSPTFCNCSRGWLKELFESVLERSVEVVLEKSVRQGNDVCKFRILL